MRVISPRTVPHKVPLFRRLVSVSVAATFRGKCFVFEWKMNEPPFFFCRHRDRFTIGESGTVSSVAPLWSPVVIISRSRFVLFFYVSTVLSEENRNHLSLSGHFSFGPKWPPTPPPPPKWRCYPPEIFFLRCALLPPRRVVILRYLLLHFLFKKKGIFF